MVTRDMKGVTSGPIHGKLGVRAGNTGWVHCDEVRVPASHRIGKEGEGFKIAMSCLDNGRYTVAAGALGLTRASLDASIAYAHQRNTFGVEIGEHQLVKRMISLMVQRVEAGNLLVYRAGWQKNQGIRNTRETTLAKWFCTDASFDSASDAIQIHGAYGFSDEYDRRALPAQQQGRSDLRRHARIAATHSSRLYAGLPRRQASALRTPGLRSRFLAI